MAEKAILFDATRCNACRDCQAACRSWNANSETPEPGQSSATGGGQDAADLSPRNWLAIRSTEITSPGGTRRLFTRRACLHCTDAACILVCPNGSVYRHELGFVAYDQDACTGCGYCEDACPFDVPRLTRNILTGLARMDKCNFCTTPGLDRIAAGRAPACVEACATGALSYGDRQDLLAAGRERVQALREKGWAQANLYGANELGGLHVLYVLDESPAVYGLPASPEIPAAAIARKYVIQPVGWVVGILALVGLGMNWMVARINANKGLK
jgi:formate dehydrogenase iron-sulfur subunit